MPGQGIAPNWGSEGVTLGGSPLPKSGGGGSGGESSGGKARASTGKKRKAAEAADDAAAKRAAMADAAERRLRAMSGESTALASCSGSGGGSSDGGSGSGSGAGQADDAPCEQSSASRSERRGGFCKDEATNQGGSDDDPELAAAIAASIAGVAVRPVAAKPGPREVIEID